MIGLILSLKYGMLFQCLFYTHPYQNTTFFQFFQSGSCFKLVLDLTQMPYGILKTISDVVVQCLVGIGRSILFSLFTSQIVECLWNVFSFSLSPNLFPISSAFKMSNALFYIVITFWLAPRSYLTYSSYLDYSPIPV